MHYRERLFVPVGWWLIGLAALATVWVIVAVPAGVGVAIAVTAAATAGLVTLFLRYGGAVVEVGPDTLVAGRARISRDFVGGAEPFTGEAARRARGRDADHRSYLLLRPYLTGLVRITITDPADPTPYWLVSTRHPEQLAAALTTDSRRPS